MTQIKNDNVNASTTGNTNSLNGSFSQSMGQLPNLRSQQSINTSSTNTNANTFTPSQLYSQSHSQLAQLIMQQQAQEQLRQQQQRLSLLQNNIHSSNGNISNYLLIPNRNGLLQKRKKKGIVLFVCVSNTDSTVHCFVVVLFFTLLTHK